MHMDDKVKMGIPYTLLLIFIGIPFIVGTTRQYAVIFAVAILILIFNFSYKIKIRSGIEKLPIWILLIWMYGIGVGILRGNSSSDILQNFAGMSVYVLGVILLNTKSFNYKALYKALYVASVIVCFEVLIVYLFRMRGMIPPWPLSNIGFNYWTSTIYTGISALIFVLEAVSLWNLLRESEKRNRIRNFALLILSAVSIFATMDSGGYILGYAIILAVVLIMSLKTNRYSRKYWVLSVFFLLIILFAAMYYESRTGAVTGIFSINASGNVKRYYQFGLVRDRFTIFGNGLGSRLEYSYGVRTYDSYGLEVSYLNLVDKFGVLGLVLILLYIYSFVKPIRMLAKGKGIAEFNVIAIGLQGYFFVALGNPVIYAPYNVVLHVFAIMFISYSIIQAKFESNSMQEANGLI